MLSGEDLFLILLLKMMNTLVSRLAIFLQELEASGYTFCLKLVRLP